MRRRLPLASFSCADPAHTRRICHCRQAKLAPRPHRSLIAIALRAHCAPQVREERPSRRCEGCAAPSRCTATCATPPSSWRKASCFARPLCTRPCCQRSPHEGCGASEYHGQTCIMPCQCMWLAYHARPPYVSAPYTRLWVSFGYAGSGSWVAAIAAPHPTSTRASAHLACTPSASSTQRPRRRSTWMCTLPPRATTPSALAKPTRRTASARKPESTAAVGCPPALSSRSCTHAARL